MKRLALLAVLVSSASLAACGKSAEDKAKAQVCSARADIQKNVRKLQGLTIATATTGAVTDSVKAIRDDLGKIKDAQPQLSSELRKQVRAANQTFESELKATVSDVGSNLSLRDAQATIKSAAQRLANSYRQSLAEISCG
jgi:regulatory protein YycI of two-component signal transduction system YycFG